MDWLACFVRVVTLRALVHRVISEVTEVISLLVLVARYLPQFLKVLLLDRIAVQPKLVLVVVHLNFQLKVVLHKQVLQLVLWQALQV